MQTDEILPRLESAFLKSKLSESLQDSLKFSTIAIQNRVLVVKVSCLEDLADISMETYKQLLLHFCGDPAVRLIVYECSEKRWTLPSL